MLFLISILLLVVSTSTFASDDVIDYPYVEFAKTCIKSDGPEACLNDHGFDCSTGYSPSMTIGAYKLFCNLVLSDGRVHFVQILNENGEYRIEKQDTNIPEPGVQANKPMVSKSALEDYIQGELSSYDIFSAGGIGGEVFDIPAYAVLGLRNGDLEYRNICGFVPRGETSELLSMKLRSACEESLLEMIKRFSQPTESGPYRVPAASEVEWQSRFATLSSGESAFIIDGTFAFERGHVSCRLVGCCSREGSMFLDSCREPTENEMRAVLTCRSLGTQSTEYRECLRENGIKIDCDENSDGSQTCY